ncbi:RNA-directed DNA polymerase, eukaryota, reverse transcriptase zinc-binding domain protein [Tanacetum coccineum]
MDSLWFRVIQAVHGDKIDFSFSAVSSGEFSVKDTRLVLMIWCFPLHSEPTRRFCIVFAVGGRSILSFEAFRSQNGRWFSSILLRVQLLRFVGRSLYVDIEGGGGEVNLMVDVEDSVENRSQTGVNSVLVEEVSVENVCQTRENIVGSQGSNSQKGDKEGSKVSYAKIVNNNSLDNKLDLIPTEINEDGIEVVIFDEEIVSERSKKWELTVCGYFVGYKTSYQELRLGTPLIMDQVTTSMCKGRTGRFGFARVLIDVEAVKGIPDKVEIVYKNRDGKVTGKKSVDVNYDWASPVCSFCKVFGHCDKNCVKRPKSIEEFMEIKREELRKKQENGGYEHVRYKEKSGKRENPKGEKKIDNEELKGKKVYELVEKVSNNKGDTSGNDVVKEQLVDKGSPKTGWKIQNDIINRIRKSANKFVVLKEENKNGNMPMRENEIEEEVIDVYDETSGSARKMAQKDIGSSYVEILNRTVLETRMKGNKINEIGNRVFGRWNWYDNAFECSRGCRVLIGWDNEKIQGGIVHAFDQAVLCLFEIQSSKQRLFCTFIHVEISGKLRKNLNPEDHSKGISYVTQDMEEFRDCINCIKMEDICSSGLHYTQIKSLLNHNNRIMKKIDRVMGNEEFFEKHTRDHVVFLPYGIFDHSPAILTCPQTLKAKKKSFRFANYVADKEEFQWVVKDKWNTEVEGFAMLKLVKMLKAMKPTMNKLNWKNGNLFDKVKKIKSIFDEIQTRKADLTNKTKVEWLKEGDRNSTYFYKVLKSRSNRCRVEEICGEDNVRYSGDQVPVQFEDWNMIIEVSNMEIKEAIFDINDNKAPGPDGFTTKFFKKAWDTVGNDVCKAVKEFFSKGKLLGELNATLITLVPKVSTLHKVSDFRPIACCNVVNKCISKIITNRIKNALDSIVNKNQSAFIPERQITDNFLLTQELLKGYNCVRGPKRCSMKIDIQKAYDTVNWKFLEKALRLFGFHTKMIQWIMLCVTTPSYSICLNGERHGFFKGGRGLRQGDPLSPYLFTLVMEVFNLIIQQEIKGNGNFKYHHGCKELEITYFCFADDLLVLCHGDVNSVNVIKKALDKFSSVLGLYPNLGKSTIFCGSMDRATIDAILHILHFKKGKLPVRYLGVLLVSKKIGVKDCKCLIDKVKSRVQDWKNNSLSYARRTQLIASVLSSIQVYWASVFKLPKLVIDDIEKIFKSFLWNKGELQKGKAKVAWKYVCQPKQNRGLGLKLLESWNNALLVKHLWNLANKKDSLWVKWVSTVKLKERSVWEMEK